MRKCAERLAFTVPVETKARWKGRAATQGISLSELVRRAVADDKQEET